MRPVVAFAAFMATLLALLLWQGSDALVQVWSPFRPVRSTYSAPVLVELEGSPVYYPHERQLHRRAAQPQSLLPANVLNIMGSSQPCPTASAVTSTMFKDRTVTKTVTVSKDITPTSASSLTTSPTVTASAV